MNDLIYILPVLPVVFLMAGAYYMLFARNDDARSRLKEIVNDSRNAQERKKALQTQVMVLKRKQKGNAKQQQLALKLDQADWLLKPQEFMYFKIACSVVCSLVTMFLGWGWLANLILSVIGYQLPNGYLNFKIWLRMQKAEATFADVLAMMVTSFKSGLGFNRVTQLVAESNDGPWAVEFNKLNVEMNLGSTQEEALKNLAKRMPLPDVHLFVAALTIQKETGGNLVEVLSILSATIRDRFKLKRKVGALTAQGKLSAVVVFLVPVLIGGLLTLGSPDMMWKFATSLVGQIALTIAVILQMMGGFVLMKITQIEV